MPSYKLGLSLLITRLCHNSFVHASNVVPDGGNGQKCSQASSCHDPSLIGMNSSQLTNSLKDFLRKIRVQSMTREREVILCCQWVSILMYGPLCWLTSLTLMFRDRYFTYLTCSSCSIAHSNHSTSVHTSRCSDKHYHRSATIGQNRYLYHVWFSF